MNAVKCEHWKCSNDATERRVDDDLVFLAFDTCGRHDQGEWSHLLLTYPAPAALEDETMTECDATDTCQREAVAEVTDGGVYLLAVCGHHRDVALDCLGWAEA